MSSSLIIVLLLVLLLVAVLPTWGYSRSWGHTGTTIVGAVLVVVIVLLVLGYI